MRLKHLKKKTFYGIYQFFRGEQFRKNEVFKNCLKIKFTPTQETLRLYIEREIKDNFVKQGDLINIELLKKLHNHPDFNAEKFQNAPNAKWVEVEIDGVTPDNFHSTSMFPEYCKINGKWILAEESRMDSSIVLRENETLDVIENRNVKIGDQVIVGRTEKAEEGIFVWTHGFKEKKEKEIEDNFVFRQGRSRETSYAKDYDRLVELLKFEKHNGGRVLWVMGPAFSFDAKARSAMQKMVEEGYVDCLMAGNALATHDLEGAYFHTALGQDIYTQKSQPNGHYNHLDICNKVRRNGSIEAFIENEKIDNGIIYSCVKKNIPLILTSSIRDNGPLPEVIPGAYEGQAKMREQVKKATTIITLATMLHTIATGNMTPSFRVLEDKTIRPLYFYTVDADEFVVNKLIDRGSLSATTIVTNVQDFITKVAAGLDLKF